MFVGCCKDVDEGDDVLFLAAGKKKKWEKKNENNTTIYLSISFWWAWRPALCLICFFLFWFSTKKKIAISLKISLDIFNLFFFFHFESKENFSVYEDMCRVRWWWRAGEIFLVHINKQKRFSRGEFLLVFSRKINCQFFFSVVRKRRARREEKFLIVQGTKL